MQKRWLRILKNRIPKLDLADIFCEKLPFNTKKRQFAPEYSQIFYEAMLN